MHNKTRVAEEFEIGRKGTWRATLQLIADGTVFQPDIPFDFNGKPLAEAKRLMDQRGVYYRHKNESEQ